MTKKEINDFKADCWNHLRSVWIGGGVRIEVQDQVGWGKGVPFHAMIFWHAGVQEAALEARMWQGLTPKVDVF